MSRSRWLVAPRLIVISASAGGASRTSPSQAFLLVIVRSITRAIVLPALVALTAACGGRSELFDELDAHDGGMRDASRCGAPLPSNACMSALSGATPAPTYCSTRAMLAPYPAPLAPDPTWTVQLPSDRSPIQILVDDCGQTFATYDPNLGASQAFPYVLVALDAGGDITMTHDFSPDPLISMFIARDGSLRGMVGFRERTFVRVDRDGEVTRLGALPPSTRRYVVASDETLVITTSDLRSPAQLTRVAPDGTVLWTSPALTEDGPCAGCLSEAALLPDDRAVVASYTLEGGADVHVLDAFGAIAWTRHIDGQLIQGPAVALDSTVRLVTGLTDDGGVPTTVVTSLSSSGEVLWQTVLAEDYQQTWSSPIVIAADGATLIRSFGGLTVIEPNGTIRWRIEGPNNLTYDAAVDPRGTLVMLFGAIVGWDMANGRQRWEVSGPGFVDGSYHFLSHFALAADGCVIGANYGGVLFAACDD